MKYLFYFLVGILLIIVFFGFLPISSGIKSCLDHSAQKIGQFPKLSEVGKDTLCKLTYEENVTLKSCIQDKKDNNIFSSLLPVLLKFVPNIKLANEIIDNDNSHCPEYKSPYIL